MTEACDVLVIGGGPAGMAAATQAAELGCSVILIDEQSGPGGQIYRGAETTKTPTVAAALGPDYRHGGELAASFRASGAVLRAGLQVCQIQSDGHLFATDGERLTRFDWRRLIVAPGALERPVPVPGWTLPGVMTVGAAQILFKSGGLVPDKDVWVVGSGPLPLLYISQILRAGGRIAGFLDTAASPFRAEVLRHLPQALKGMGQLRQGLGLLRTLRRSGLPHEKRVEDVEILGTSRVEGLRFRQNGAWHERPASGVLLHEGVVPNIHITMSLRCRHEWDARQLAFRPALDAFGRTDRDGIIVAGDAGGIGGAAAAEWQGRLAALAAATDLGRLTAADCTRRAAPIRVALARHTAIRPLLDTLYRARDALLAPADHVVACRCESLTAGDVRAAVADGCLGPDQVKSQIRCGMGPCQGRECGLTLTGIIAAARGLSPAEVGFFRIRPPLKQLKLGELANLLAQEAAE